MAGDERLQFVGSTFEGPQGPKVLVVNETASFVDIGDEAAPIFPTTPVSEAVLGRLEDAEADVEGALYGLPEGHNSMAKIGHNHGGPEEGHRADDGNGGLFSRSRHGKKPAFGEVVGLGSPIDDEEILHEVDGFPIPVDQRIAFVRYQNEGGATGPLPPAA